MFDITKLKCPPEKVEHVNKFAAELYQMLEVLGRGTVAEMMAKNTAPFDLGLKYKGSFRQRKKQCKKYIPTMIVQMLMAEGCYYKE